MDDLIRRADAFEAKLEYRNEDMWDKEKSTYNKGWNDCNDAWVAIIKALPSAEAIQVTDKLNKYDDSLLKTDSEACKEQKSKLDLISREDVVREIVEWIQMATDNETDMAIKDFLSFLKERIISIPSAEAVKVVRCKDCEYWHSNTEFCGIWSCLNVAQRTLPDDYCSRGERREDGEA